jgi:PAX-interacting protein 1
MKDKEMEHQSNAMASDTIGQPMDWISDFDSTATSRFNKLRTEVFIWSSILSLLY